MQGAVEPGPTPVIGAVFLRVRTPALVLAQPRQGDFAHAADRRAGEGGGGEDEFVAGGAGGAGVAAGVGDAQGRGLSRQVGGWEAEVGVGVVEDLEDEFGGEGGGEEGGD